MSYKLNETDIQNRTYYFFNDMINIKNIDPDKIKMEEKTYKNIPIYFNGYVIVKNLSYTKINNVNIYTWVHWRK